MPKVFKFEIGDKVKIDNFFGKKEHPVVGKTGVIIELREFSNYDYTVRFNDSSTPSTFRESELTKLYIPKIGDLVRLTTTHEEGIVVTVDEKYKQVELQIGGILYKVIGWNKVEPIENGDVEEVEQMEIGKFEKLATELGKFTDMKNKQYGSSVDATHEMVKVLMDRYTYDENRYLIPKELLSHLLLTVRVMDKQNRIFNNPSGKGDSESPWKDILGYSLIGVEMVERT